MGNPSPEAKGYLASMNRLLEDMGGEPRQMSDILQDAGFAEDEIARLHYDYLDFYIGRFLRRWRPWVVEVLPERRADILLRRYGLSPKFRPTLVALGEKYGVSRQRIHQLLQSAVERLASPEHKSSIKQMAVEVGEDVLEMKDERD